MRLAGRYLVVPIGTVFPRQCVRTGTFDALHEIDETVATPGVISKVIGPLRHFSANQDAQLRYYLSDGALRSLARWHRAWLWITLGSITALVIAGALGHPEAAAVAMMALCGSIGAYIVRPMPLNVAAVREGEVFLLGVPQKIIAALTRGETGMKGLTEGQGSSDRS